MKSKYKKILLSVLSVCLVAVSVFLPTSKVFASNEHTVPGESFTVDVTFNFSYELGFDNTNVMIPPNHDNINNGTSNVAISYFYQYSGSKSILTTSSNVYAYRISISQPLNGFSSNNSMVLEQRYCFGSLDELQNVNVTYGNTPSATNYSSVWYVNNYQVTTLYMAVMNSLYSMTVDGTPLLPTVGLNTTVRLTITPFTVEDLTKDIYEELLQSNVNDSAIIEKLDDIYSSSSSANTKLQQIYNIATTLNTNTVEIKNLLSIANGYLLDIKNEELKQTSWLQKIWESLQRLINPNDEENDKIDEFDSESNRVDSELDDVLTDMESVPKPDVDSSIGFLEDIESIGSYYNSTPIGACLLFISYNPISATFLFINATFALVAYLFFGKR